MSVVHQVSFDPNPKMKRIIDKCWKLCSGHLAARSCGISFDTIFPLDADDLIHRDLVSHIDAESRESCWQLRLGYELDHVKKRLFATDRIDRICGSTFVLSQMAALRQDYEGDPFFASNFIVLGHNTVIGELTDRKLSVHEIPFRSVLYRVNNTTDIHPVS
jgi:hypothetical protein